MVATRALANTVPRVASGGRLLGRCFVAVACVPVLAAAGDDAIGCEGAWAESPLCVERAEALDARAQVEALLAMLATVDQPPWNPKDLADASALYDEGMELYRDEYFGDAAAKFGPALARLHDVREEFEGLLRTMLDEGNLHLANEEFGEAAEKFDRLLVWRPASQAARSGADRARTGREVARVAAEAMHVLRAGDAAGARTLLSGLPAGLSFTALADARRALREHERRERVAGRLTAGHAALDRGDWSGAESAFREALAVDAGSTAAAEGLAQAARRKTSADLASLRKSFAAQFDREDWTGALNALSMLATLAPDAPEIAEHRSRVARLAAMETRVDAALEDPRRAASASLREETRALLSQAADPVRVGRRIHEKARRLREQFDLWTQPVTLTIHSDNRTDVLIRPGRALGRFTDRELHVFPGRYTVVGRRNGFREKNVDVEVLPGSAALFVEVACDERF